MLWHSGLCPCVTHLPWDQSAGSSLGCSAVLIQFPAAALRTQIPVQVLYTWTPVTHIWRPGWRSGSLAWPSPVLLVAFGEWMNQQMDLSFFFFHINKTKKEVKNSNSIIFKRADFLDLKVFNQIPVNWRPKHERTVEMLEVQCCGAELGCWYLIKCFKFWVPCFQPASWEQPWPPSTLLLKVSHWGEWDVCQAWQDKPLPAVPIPHKDESGCSIFSSSFLLMSWKSSRGWPKSLCPCTPWEAPNRFNSGYCGHLWSEPAGRRSLSFSNLASQIKNES